VGLPPGRSLGRDTSKRNGDTSPCLGGDTNPMHESLESRSVRRRVKIKTATLKVSVLPDPAPLCPCHDLRGALKVAQVEAVWATLFGINHDDCRHPATRAIGNDTHESLRGLLSEVHWKVDSDRQPIGLRDL